MQTPKPLTGKLFNCPAASRIIRVILTLHRRLRKESQFAGYYHKGYSGKK
jgi:hypothetical protein